MAEVGESSGAKPCEELRYPDVEISSCEIVVCSEILFSSIRKCKWCNITRNSDHSSATIQNKSSDAIVVDGTVIQADNTIVIRCGSEITSGPDKEGYLSYRFNILPVPESCQKKLKISMDAEHAICCICLNIWHDVVTVAPCFHNFCNGCFSEWLKRPLEKHSSVLCPQCRAVVLNIWHEEADNPSNPCPQCGTEYGGFCCNQTTICLQCQAYGGMMPLRTNNSVPQHCLGCDKAFCGTYWHAQGVSQSDSHRVCSRETFKPISEWSISIPTSARENNRHEQVITEKCIAQLGRTLQDVIAEWLAKLNSREIDRTRMPPNHAEVITSRSPTCNYCYEKLISFLLYWFRISIPKYHLPTEASNRENCWYGYACRTHHHNEEHALKRNHVCRPTRGTNM